MLHTLPTVMRIAIFLKDKKKIKNNALCLSLIADAWLKNK
jgi:hypothetical protein